MEKCRSAVQFCKYDITVSRLCHVHVFTQQDPTSRCKTLLVDSSMFGGVVMVVVRKKEFLYIHCDGMDAAGGQIPQ